MKLISSILMLVGSVFGFFDVVIYGSSFASYVNYLLGGKFVSLGFPFSIFMMISMALIGISSFIESSKTFPNKKGRGILLILLGSLSSIAFCLFSLLVESRYLLYLGIVAISLFSIGILYFGFLIWKSSGNSSILKMSSILMIFSVLFLPFLGPTSGSFIFVFSCVGLLIDSIIVRKNRTVFSNRSHNTRSKR
ncbi:MULTISPECIES: hypothetical protein [Acidianus]|uniref:DUF998 domain-containing protein n=1 Tax=Candidatus Acidianus copahuensis TaxID=1160895 RepID=A0A031LWA6_9CREN|nr:MULTISPECIES: hypothetical protein [Acidianus]EZQ11438.1 hypothetical protein CM19_01380 [Candidatus Acidianus copahuensis]NON61748.1 hypothetical protein [Acidianus sp. RZ1]